MRYSLKRVSQRYIVSFLCILISVKGFSENFTKTIFWNTNTVNISEKKTLKEIASPCTNCFLNKENSSIEYITSIPLNSSNINNVNFSVTASSFFESSVLNAPEKFLPTYSISWEKGKPFLDIRCNPLIKSSSEIQAITAFDISFQYTESKNVVTKSLRSATNSVLASGEWYKIPITKTGMYKIDYDFFTNTLKLNTSKYSLSNFGIYGAAGGMLPTKNSVFRYDDLPSCATEIVDLNNNNVLEQGDYILFYAEGPTSWEYDNTSKTFRHKTHSYSDNSYIFFSPTQGGNRITTLGNVGTSSFTKTNFPDYQAIESDDVNLVKSGRTWLGDKFSTAASSKSYSMNFPNLNSAATITVESVFAHTSKTNNSIASLSINGNTVLTHNISPAYGTSVATDNYASGITASSSENLSLQYNFTPGSYDAIGYLDYVRINATRNLVYNGGQFNFRFTDSLGQNLFFNAEITSTSNPEIWDVSDRVNAKKIAVQQTGNKWSFLYPTRKNEFIVFDRSSLLTPSSGDKISNQNVHSVSFSDLVIVTPTEFYAAAERIANSHRTKDAMRVSIVKTNELYNEFSSGAQDITAIKDLMRMFYDRANGNANNMPKNLLLLGDASYDYKNKTTNNTNFVPTFESIYSYNIDDSYNSDDYFGYLDTTEGGDDIKPSERLDIGIGRIVCKSMEEANDVIDKIIHYKETPSYGDWRNYVTFVCDDADESYDNDFIIQSEGIANSLTTKYPALNLEKIYSDAFVQQNFASGQRYPDAQKALLDRIYKGTLILSYIGHGGPTNWAQERLFGSTEILALTNKDRLPLFVTATCDFAPFDNPTLVSAGENLQLLKSGGSVGIVATTRAVLISSAGNISTSFYNEAFKKDISTNKYRTIGEVLRSTKNNSPSYDVQRFALLCDPALTLNYPMLNVVTTKLNQDTITLATDTLKALKKITISGEVRDLNNNLVNSFNGICYPTVFDKTQTMPVLQNDANALPFQYKTQKNIVFKGKASITNGKFQFTFVVPKDIDYAYGLSKISYYVDNTSDGKLDDGNGYTNTIIIGGAENGSSDNKGPDVRLFMNDEKFAFGGTTDQNPILLAKLSDENGINTVGNGIGHDITGVIDNDEKNKIVLNDFFSSNLNDYTSGKVNYPFSKLTEGKHTLKVKAWDVYNNPGEGYTEFIVASNAEIALRHVLNYPNPFTTNTYFQFEHNKPGETLDVTVQVCTISGKVVKSIHQQVSSEGYRVDKQISWNGLDDYGDKIGKGVYVYKLMVRTQGGQTAHALEKLVVLR